MTLTAFVSRRQLARSRSSAARPLLVRRVVLRVAAGLRQAPFGGEQAAVVQPVQGRIERSLADLDDIARDLLQPLGDRVAVLRTAGDDGEDEQVERALRKIGLGWRHRVCLALRHVA